MITPILFSSLLLVTGDPNFSYVTQCDDRGLGCKLTTFEVPGSSTKSKDFQGTFKISYRFPCGNTTGHPQSKLQFTATENKSRPTAIRYQGNETVSVDGSGPVFITETDAAGGNSELGTIYQNKRCALYIDKVEVEPSQTQLNVWAAKRAGIVSNLNAAKAIYESQSTVAFWLEMYKSNPASFRAIIEETIAKLEKEAEDDPWGSSDLELYKAILSDAPDQAVRNAYAKINSTVDKVVEEAQAMEAVRLEIGLAPDQGLIDLIAATRAAGGAK